MFRRFRRVFRRSSPRARFPNASQAPGLVQDTSRLSGSGDSTGYLQSFWRVFRCTLPPARFLPSDAPVLPQAHQLKDRELQAKMRAAAMGRPGEVRLVPAPSLCPPSPSSTYRCSPQALPLRLLSISSLLPPSSFPSSIMVRFPAEWAYTPGG